MNSIQSIQTDIAITQEAKCPKCKALTDYRIPRKGFFKKIFPIYKKRYWCPKCGNRFHTL